MEKIIVNSASEMMELGKKIGSQVKSGVNFELVGDVGAGKTTFTKGLAKGLMVDETVQSPSFTINRIYEGREFQLSHYDFYRLNDPGIMKLELAESLADKKIITVIEWAEGVENVLPQERITIYFNNISDEKREVEIKGLPGDFYI